MTVKEIIESNKNNKIKLEILGDYCCIICECDYEGYEKVLGTWILSIETENYGVCNGFTEIGIELR